VALVVGGYQGCRTAIGAVLLASRGTTQNAFSRNSLALIPKGSAEALAAFRTIFARPEAQAIAERRHLAWGSWPSRRGP
jgi:hypothetical protein